MRNIKNVIMEENSKTVDASDIINYGDDEVEIIGVAEVTPDNVSDINAEIISIGGENALVVDIDDDALFATDGMTDIPDTGLVTDDIGSCDVVGMDDYSDDINVM